MQETVKSLAMSMVTGIVFGLAAIATVLVVGPMFDDPYSDSMDIDLPEGIVFLEHMVKPQSRHFTVQGRLENKTDDDWRYVQLNVEVFAGDASISECTGSIEHVKINEVRNFEVACRRMSGISVPSNVTYKIHVESATRLREI